MQLLKIVGCSIVLSFTSACVTATTNAELVPALFDVNQVSGLAHTACALQLPNEKSEFENMVNYGEVSICDSEGMNCQYGAALNLNQKPVFLKQIKQTQSPKSAIFSDGTYTAEVIYHSNSATKNDDDEGEMVQADITLSVGKLSQSYKMSGYCGV